MADYQITHLSLSTRIELVSLMLDPLRPWGLVTELSREHDVSRKFLYELREKAVVSISKALLPHAAGRKANNSLVEINEGFVRRAIAICLSVVPGTVRTVQLLLDLLFDVQRSVGYLSQTAKKIGAEAFEFNQSRSLPILALAEADEIFQGRKPCLTVVDGRSFLVLSLSAQDQRDETTWGCVLLDVQKQGVHLVDVASDGGRGIQAGVKEVSRLIPLRPDLFHLIREAYRVTQRLEKRAYTAIDTVGRARRAKQEQDLPKRRQGAPLKVKVDLPQAEAAERQAIEQLDAWEWLFHEIRQAIEPFDREGHIVSSKQVRQTVTTALELLTTLNNETIQAFTPQLYDKLDELIAPLEWLEQALAPWRERLQPDLEAFIIWAWKHQKELEITFEQVLPASQQNLVVAFWNALSLFHRSSSLAESLHSWLRPYLQVHRGMPKWLLPLLQSVWNHHVFQRGKRQGKSPMELAGLEKVPALSSLIDLLAETEKSIPLPNEFFKVPEKCYPISLEI
jgi:hypothetical protein